MLEVTVIDRLDSDELSIFRTLKQQTAHREQGLFVAESPKVIDRLLDTTLTVVSLLATPQWLSTYEERLKQRPEKVIVFVAEKPLLETLVGFPLFQGLLACAKIPVSLPLELILAKAEKSGPALLVALDGVTNPENLGVIVRVCVGLRVHGLILGETSASPYLRRSVRNSMGNIFHCNITETKNLAETISMLKERGVQCLAADLAPNSIPVTQCDLKSSTCLVFGHEGRGVSKPILEACGQSVVIPMPNKMDSLNVGSAASILLYEACRQRGLFNV
ncbi:MAG: hypothetical protein JWN25_2322 [Verrucomicrobiales bacterium]|nr:hypothetical protein [Verrucomicrobiales bacterium]